jgi:hypothetical protein
MSNANKEGIPTCVAKNMAGCDPCALPREEATLDPVQHPPLEAAAAMLAMRQIDLADTFSNETS